VNSRAFDKELMNAIQETCCAH